jgi:hypothetical protein
MPVTGGHPGTMVVTALHNMSSFRNRPPAEKEKLGANVTRVKELVRVVGLLHSVTPHTATAVCLTSLVSAPFGIQASAGQGPGALDNGYAREYGGRWGDGRVCW